MESKSHTKHSLWVRITHWINFVVLSVMVWSGALILWANRQYPPLLPESFYKSLGLGSRLAEGMSYHFAFMWFFALNTIVYLTYVIVSGHWREIVPGRGSLKNALLVVAHDLKIRRELPPQGKFNAAQQFAYTGVLVMLALALVSGIAIYKPVQLYWLKDAFGNYYIARLIHYWIALAFILFFFVHIAQVIKAGWKNFSSMVGGKLAFSIFGISIFATFIGWQALRDAPLEDGTRSPLRQFLQWNENLAEGFVGIDRIDQAGGAIPIGRKARVNGLIGLDIKGLESEWLLNVVTPADKNILQPQVLTLTMKDLFSFPKVEILSELRCVEGWSEVMSFAGVPFRTFIQHYSLGTHSGKAPDWENNFSDLYRYVGLETSDGKYYVSIDMKSMLNPHTMLAYEQNGEPLSAAHGAPLRLYIPNKYGVKSLKRIGKITFSDTPLNDYWGEYGYDWFLGL